MPPRGRSHSRDPVQQPCNAEDATRTAECEPSDGAPEARQVLEVLADYFALLRQWELNSRPDSGLAPDSAKDAP